MIWLAIAVAGGLGAACRFVVDHVVTVRLSHGVPWGTLLVNVSGAFGAGVVTGLVAEHALSADARLVVAGGFLGAYTTFSTAMYESLRLWEDGARRAAFGVLVAPLVLTVVAATAGWLLVT